MTHSKPALLPVTRSLLVAAVLSTVLFCRSLCGATFHSMYSGKIGKDHVQVVLEFRDDKTVEGAFVVDSEFNLDTKDPFPLRRIRGTNPQNGVMKLEVSLRGAVLGEIHLKRQAKPGRFDGPVWAGEFKGDGAGPVSWERGYSTFTGPALVNSVSDDEFRAWLSEERMLGYLKEKKAAQERAIRESGDRDARIQWPFRETLMPAISDDGDMAREPCVAASFKVADIEGGAITLQFDLDEDAREEARRLNFPAQLRQGKVSTALMWNQARDGDFVLEKGQEGFGTLNKQGECAGFSVSDVFIGEHIRLVNGSELELRGRLWLLPGYDDEGNIVQRAVKPLSKEPKVLRPFYWSADEMVFWHKSYGYSIAGGGRGGEGGVALEALPKSGTGSASTTAPEPSWLDLRNRSDMKRMSEDGGTDFPVYFLMETMEGIPSPKGLILFQSHPEFYIPWNRYGSG